MVEKIIQQVIDLLSHINREQYTQNIAVLSNASIGGHIRHSIEMYQCLEVGYETNVVNYSNRKRDIQIETNPFIATECFKDILIQLSLPHNNKYIKVEHNGLEAESSYQRELLYCMDHLIHHLALVKVALNILNYPSIPDDFGVAPSTIAYRKSCAH